MIASDSTRSRISRRLRRRILSAAALAAGALSSSDLLAQTTVTWANPVSGLWTDPTRWSPQQVPSNNGSATFNAVIGTSGSPYFVDQTGDIAIQNLTLNSSDATLRQLGGTFTVNQFLQLQAGTTNFTGGTLNVGTLDTFGFPARFNWTSGTLNIVGTPQFQINGSGSAPLGATVAVVGGQTLRVRDMDIGRGPGGTLNISGGGRVTWAGAGTIEGDLAVGVNTATPGNLSGVSATGTGSELNMRRIYVGVGRGNIASLSISNGATASTQYILLGNEAGNASRPPAIGFLTVNAGTLSNPFGSLDVANNGAGTVVISNGGVVNVGTARFGLRSATTGIIDGSGTLIIGGSGSQWNVLGTGSELGNVFLGGTEAADTGGVGFVRIDPDATVNIQQTLKLWNNQSSVQLSGGALSVGSLDTFGDPSRFNWTSGTLNITGTLDFPINGSGSAPLGSIVAISGGQTLRVRDIEIGRGPGGTLNISGGGRVIWHGVGSVEGELAVGINTATPMNLSAVSVTGTGSELTMRQIRVGIGRGNIASLSISNGAAVNTQFLLLGGTEFGNAVRPPAVGHLSIADATLNVLNANLVVADNGAATVSISSNGVVNTGSAFFGTRSASAGVIDGSGTLIIDGAGARWNVLGAEPTNELGHVYLGGTNVMNKGGRATVIVNDGTVTVQQQIRFWNQHCLMYVNGGTLNVGSLRQEPNLAIDMRGGRLVQTGGTIIAGPVSVIAGELSLGSNNSLLRSISLDGGTLMASATDHLGGSSETLSLSNASVFRAAGSIDLARPVVIGGSGATIDVAGTATTSFALDLMAPMSGTGTLMKSGPGALSLLAAGTFAGPVRVDGGTIRLAGGTAALPNVNSYAINPGGRLHLDESVSASGPGSGPEGNGAAVTLSDGTFTFQGGAGTNSTASLGTLTLQSGANTVELLNGGGGTTEVTFSSLVRTAGSHSTIDLLASGPGSTNKLKFTSGVSAGFIGSWFTVNGTDFTKYDTTDGVKPFDPGDYSSSFVRDTHVKLTASAAVPDTSTNPPDPFNVRTLNLAANVGSVNVTIPASTTLLLSEGGLIKSGSGSSTISGGTLTTVTDGEMNINVSGGELTISSVLPGDFTLTKRGAGTLILSGGAPLQGRGTPTNVDDLENRGVNGTLRLEGTFNVANAVRLVAGSTVVAGTLNGGTGGFEISGGTNSVISGGVANVGSADLNLIGNNSPTLTLQPGGPPGKLVLGGGVTVSSHTSGTAAIQTGTIELTSGSHSFNVASGSDRVDLLVSSDIGGGGSIIKTGPGLMRMVGSNSFTGGTQINTGTLEVEQSLNLSGGSVSFGGGTLGLRSDAPLTTFSNSLSGTSGAVRINLSRATAGTPGIFAFGAATLGSSMTLSGEGTLQLSAAVRTTDLTITNGATLVIDGTISSQPPPGDVLNHMASSGSFGTLIMRGATPNTHTGTTQLDGGTMILNKTSTIASPVLAIPDNLQINAGTAQLLGGDEQIANSATVKITELGVLDLNGRTETIAALDISEGTVLTNGGTLILAGSTSLVPGTVISVGSGSLGVSIGAGSLAGSLVFNPANPIIDVTASSQSLTISSSITSSGGGLTKSGAGELLLSGANTFNGQITVNGGMLSAATAANLGGNATTLSLNNGMLRLLGAGSFSNPMVVGGTNAGLDVVPGNSVTYTGNISGSGGFTKSGGGNLVLTQALNYSGATSVTGGLLQFGGGVGSYISGTTLTGGTWIVNGASAPATLDLGPGATITINQGSVTLNGASASFAQINALTTNQGRFTITNGKRFTTTSSGLTNSGSLTIGPNSVLRINGDLTNTGIVELNHGLIVDYTAASPLSTIKSQITSGYSSGSWNGTAPSIRIVSPASGYGLGYAEASAIFTVFPATFLGETGIDNTTVLVRYTRYGDADLSGTVNLNDFNRLAASFGLSSGALWSQGDFDYSGTVNLNDFNRLAANFGLSAGPDGQVDPSDWAALASVVPEPSIGVVLFSLVLLTPRLRRRTHRN